jgi:cardiolipin synthase
MINVTDLKCQGIGVDFINEHYSSNPENIPIPKPAENPTELTAFSSPLYLCETFQKDNNGTNPVCDFLGRFKSMLEGKMLIGFKDLNLNFVPTYDNKLTPLRDREEFWSNLVHDIKNARKSINIHIFGMQADEWGWEFAKMLSEKAKEGVKIRILVDKSGARMTFFTGYASKKLFNYYKENGIDVVFFTAKNLYKEDGDWYHYDHRKYFIIDGKTAYNTGYTLEQHMRREMFDIGVRAEGSIVRQMQASFFLSFIANGGKIEHKNFQSFFEEYFPLQTEIGTQMASLAMNIPRERHKITESYYKRISNAHKSVFVINPYFTHKKIVKSLLKAAQNGAEVKVILPLNPENSLYAPITMGHADKLVKHGVKVFLYEGPEKFGKLHAKGILIDDFFVSIGSCNMDKWALYHNFEQNIESEDPVFAGQVLERIFNYALNYSTIYVPPAEENSQTAFPR